LNQFLSHGIENLPHTRTTALERARRIRPALYAQTRNNLDGAVTGMSPYLTHGILTLRELLAEVLARGPLPVEHKLVFELGWREYFRHAWLHAANGIFESLHPGPLPDNCYLSEVPGDIRTAYTGVPAIDEAVRTLYTTGTLHNHARMWLASYVVHIRRVHWRAGADWLVAHLLDGDLASNHLSWQWVAGTGSHKPYLFNADNVARYAPAPWHSTGTVIDQSYEWLDHMARSGSIGPLALASGPEVAPHLTTEPPLLCEPPTNLSLRSPQEQTVASLAGREVWLVHPWALRAPPAGVSADAVVIGVYLKEYHHRWPWSATRWAWVDAAMAEVTPLRCWVDARGLATVLAGAARVRSVDDPHITQWLEPVAQLDKAAALFPAVDRHCTSFSQWWGRSTRGFRSAEEFL
jgi:deoxyribodipyrimidine photo-lyase